jgi:hypothetical protein
VLFPSISATAILAILAGGTLAVALAGAGLLVYRRARPSGSRAAPLDRSLRSTWRMPPLTLLTTPTLSVGRRIGLSVLRTYLLIAMILVVVRVVQLAFVK